MAKTYTGYGLNMERKLRWESLRHAVDYVEAHAHTQVPDDLLDQVQDHLDAYRRSMTGAKPENHLAQIHERRFIIEGED